MLRQRPARLVLSLMMVMLVAVAAFPAVVVAQPTITTDPQTGVLGDTEINFIITGLTPGAFYRIVILGPNGEEFGGPGFGAADDGTPDAPQGALGWSSFANEPIGTYTLQLLDEDDNVVATTTFTITEPELASDAFERTWARTDKPVEDGAVSRTWMWGPHPVTPGKMEAYEDAPGGERLVQYFDKSRMEDNSFNTTDAPWDVTNGLLVVELVTGMQQVGDEEFEEWEPAEIQIAGDPVPPHEALTYADINTFGLRDADAADEGSELTWWIDADGTITEGDQPDGEDVTAAHRVTVPQIDHTVASVFWDFMNATGPVWENGQVVTDDLFEDPFYATGYPITEAYWSTVLVNGDARDVLWQCFERRCLTYTPGNSDGFVVEFGNVGQHYWIWRYQPFPSEQTFPPMDLEARIDPLNESGVTGTAAFHVEEQQLTVHIELAGLEPGQVHPMHIHGFDWTGPDFQPSTCPTPELDTNGNGLIELEEGLPAYGDVIIPLEPSPTAAADGTLTFDGTFAFAEHPSLLTQLTVIVHGMTADLDGDGDGTEQYEPTLPVACGQIGPQAAPGDALIIGGPTLTGANEVPPVETAAGGSIYLTWNADGTLSWRLFLANIEDVTTAEIQLGSWEETGPAVVTLFDVAEGDPGLDDGWVDGTITADDLVGALEGMTIEDLVHEIATYNAYVNVETEANPAGEIRAQLVVLLTGDELFVAELSGANEVPPVATDARGVATFIVWAEASDEFFCLEAAVVVEGIEDVTGAHIHLGGPGQNGEVVLPLYPSPSGDAAPGALVTDVFCGDKLVGPLEEHRFTELVELMRAGEVYVNVHSETHPAGEIRGQVEPVLEGQSTP